MIATLDDVTSKKNNRSRLLAEPGSDQRQERALRPPSWAVIWQGPVHGSGWQTRRALGVGVRAVRGLGVRRAPVGAVSIWNAQNSQICARQPATGGELGSVP